MSEPIHVVATPPEGDHGRLYLSAYKVTKTGFVLCLRFHYDTSTGRCSPTLLTVADTALSSDELEEKFGDRENYDALDESTWDDMVQWLTEAAVGTPNLPHLHAEADK